MTLHFTHYEILDEKELWIYYSNIAAPKVIKLPITEENLADFVSAFSFHNISHSVFTSYNFCYYLSIDYDYFRFCGSDHHPIGCEVYFRRGKDGNWLLTDQIRFHSTKLTKKETIQLLEFFKRNLQKFYK